MNIENKRFKRYQIVDALKDPKTYILFVLSFAAQIPNGLLTSFRSQVSGCLLNVNNGKGSQILLDYTKYGIHSFTNHGPWYSIGLYTGHITPSSGLYSLPGQEYPDIDYDSEYRVNMTCGIWRPTIEFKDRKCDLYNRCSVYGLPSFGKPLGPVGRLLVYRLAEVSSGYFSGSEECSRCVLLA